MIAIARAYWREIIASVLQALAIGAAAWFAFSYNNEPATPAQSAVFVLIAAILQASASLLFSRIGRPKPAATSPTHARASIRRLATLAEWSLQAKELAERTSARDVPASEVRGAMGHLSVHLSYIHESIVMAGDDWIDHEPLYREDQEGGDADG